MDLCIRNSRNHKTFAIFEKMYFMLSISKLFKLSRLERMQCHMSGFCIYSYTTYIYIYNYIYTVLRRLLHLLQPWYCRLGFLCWDYSDFFLGQLLLCSVDNFKILNKQTKTSQTLYCTLHNITSLKASFLSLFVNVRSGPSTNVVQSKGDFLVNQTLE